MQTAMCAYVYDVLNHDITPGELDERLEEIAKREEDIAAYTVGEGRRRQRLQITENRAFLHAFAEMLPHYNNVDEIAALEPQRARDIARAVLWAGSPSWIIGGMPDEDAPEYQRTKLMLLPVLGRLQPKDAPEVHSIVNRRLLACRQRANTARFEGLSVIKRTTPGSIALSALDPQKDGHRDFELDDLTLIRYRVPQHLVLLAGRFACLYNLQRLLEQPDIIDERLQQDA